MIHYILIGLIAGWAAGQLIRGEGYGMVADILLGIIGSVIGGALVSVFGIHAHHLLGAIVVSTLGASTLVMGTRIVRGEI
jgi:uncharacterized membrane protein YeaQ/YmgE (transglycosylase-associated protein family)